MGWVSPPCFGGWREGGGAMYAPNIDMRQAWPCRLAGPFAVGEDGERTLGDYGFNHTPNRSSPPACPGSAIVPVVFVAEREGPRGTHVAGKRGRVSIRGQTTFSCSRLEKRQIRGRPRLRNPGNKRGQSPVFSGPSERLSGVADSPRGQNSYPDPNYSLFLERLLHQPMECRPILPARHDFCFISNMICTSIPVVDGRFAGLTTSHRTHQS